MQSDWIQGLIIAGLVAITAIGGSISGSKDRIRQAMASEGWKGGAREAVAACSTPMILIPAALCILFYPPSVLVIVAAYAAFVWLRYRHRKAAM